jgi:hypothetical protein
MYMVAVTIPATLLVRFIPRDGSRPSKEEYEAVPMLEANEREADDGQKRARTSAMEV